MMNNKCRYIFYRYIQHVTSLRVARKSVRVRAVGRRSLVTRRESKRASTYQLAVPMDWWLVMTSMNGNEIERTELMIARLKLWDILIRLSKNEIEIYPKLMKSK